MSEPRIDFTARDYDSILLALQAHLQAKFPDTWKDFTESQMGVAWLELVAYSYSILSFYLDVQANNSYLPLARDRDAVINICRLVGYQLRPATSAAVTVTASIAAVQVVDVIIPVGTTATSLSGVTFRTLTEQRIPAGSLSAEIVFTEGEAHYDSFISDGTVFQKYQLTDAEVIAGSIEVTVAGTEWTAVDSLVFASTTSTSYTVSYDEDDYATIEFGDDSNGLIPPIGSTIAATYRAGGGIRGNIALNEITESVAGQLDIAPPTAIAVNVINDTERGSGGEARETIAHAKFWAPRWVSTNGRAVTAYDFDTLATSFVDPTYGAVAFAKAKLRQEIPELNTVDLYLWSRDALSNITEPSTGLRDALQAYFMNNGEGAVRVICTDLEAQSGNIVYIDVSTTLTVADTFAAADVSASAETALNNLFTSADIRPGEAFRLSRVYSTIQDVAGVEHALLNQLTAAYSTDSTEDTGDGVTTNFAFILELDPNLPVVPGTVTITAGAQVAQDNGDGDLLIGAVNVGGVDYDSGAVDIAFPVAPGLGVSINVTYRHILDYQRGELEQTSDADHAAGSPITGAVGYPPVVAYDVLTGEKGVAFTDGFQSLRDTLGDGILYDSSAVARGTIDYDTGGYSFNFPTDPAVGSSIRSAYRQMLRTASEDIPIDDTQLATKGSYTITTE